VLLEQLAERDRLEVAQVAGVMVVDLVGELVAGDAIFSALMTTM
jgi:hypothetical protein